MRPVQYFTDEYLEQCKRMRPAEILRFLDEFRRLHSGTGRSGSRLISLKVPEDLLEAFKAKARLCDVRYQTQIKRLMTEWVAGHPTDTMAEKRGTSRGRGKMTRGQMGG